jgi:imidazolonepropionase
VKVIAVLNASQLLTLAGPEGPRVGSALRDLSIIPGGAFLARDGIIAAIGSSAEIEKLISSDVEVVDATGRVVLPGFVDAHAHPVFAGNRIDEFEMRASGATYEEIAAKGGGIRSTVRKTRDATEEELLSQSAKHIQWFVRSGTTTVEAKSGYGLSLDDEIKMLRVVQRLNAQGPIELVPTFLGAHAFPEEFQNSRQKYVQLVIEKMIPRIADEHLAEFCDIFCERGYFDLATSRRILEAAKAGGLAIRIHADQLTNGGGAELAAELGAVTADHLEQTEGHGIVAMKRAGVQPVLLPASVYALGKTRYPRAREMIDAGLAVVLATDFNPGSSPTASMPMILSLAVTQMKMSPAEAITAATINAACSLKRGNRIGSIAVGKEANFSIFDCVDYRELTYWFGFPQTSSVYVRGQQVYSNS